MDNLFPKTSKLFNERNHTNENKEKYSWRTSFSPSLTSKCRLLLV